MKSSRLTACALRTANVAFLASARQFQRLNLPFSYIENCRIEDETFTKGLQKFISVTCMTKNFFRDAYRPGWYAAQNLFSL